MECPDNFINLINYVYFVICVLFKTSFNTTSVILHFTLNLSPDCYISFITDSLSVETSTLPSYDRP